MFARDRATTLLLLATGGGCWLLLLWLFISRSPRNDPQAQVIGAALLGLSLGLTGSALFWLAAFSRPRIAYRGSWFRAARRGVWLGGGAALFVLLRGQDAFSLPLALFVVALIAFVELTLTIRR
jgi:hypothetical protein